jgi:hypothetical protein
MNAKQKRHKRRNFVSVASKFAPIFDVLAEMIEKGYIDEAAKQARESADELRKMK